MDASVLYLFGLALVAVGIIVIVTAAILASLGKAGKGTARAAGVIMIGPIPIIFGTDKKSVKTVLLLALSLTIAGIILYYLLLR